MIRHGSCNQCGACCQFVTFLVDDSDPVAREFYAARGLEIVDGMVQVPHVCPHLTSYGEGCTAHKGLFRCDLHGEAKPEACRVFPFSERCLPAKCGFTFAEE